MEIGGDKLGFIAGPCVIESRDHALMMAEKLSGLANKYNLQLIYKSSFDKANRTSIRSFRGPGIDKGLRILEAVKKEFNLAVTTDIHDASQALAVSEVADVIQIPAFLSRQTDILVAAAKTLKIVNVKKGQFLAPEGMANIVDKLESAGCRQIMLTERGTSFGYGRLVNDMCSIPVMRDNGYPVVFDATHSVQLPGGLGSASGGRREFVELISRAAVAAGCDAVFTEVHHDPDKALCDGPNSIDLEMFEKLVVSLNRIKDAVNQ